MTDVTVTYQLPSDLTAQHAPQKIPAVFNHEKLVLYAVLRKSKPDVAVSGEGVAKLQGTLLGKKMEYCVKFNLSLADGTGSSIPIVHHLAAKQLLREWGEEGDKRKKEIISLSIENNVVSAHTAYIAIDENQQKPIEGALQTWDLSSSIASSSRFDVIALQDCGPVMFCARSTFGSLGMPISTGKLISNFDNNS